MIQVQATSVTEAKFKRMSRWLAVVAGVLVAITGSLGLGPLFVIFPSALIIGGVVESRAGARGRYLTWFGLFLVSPFAFFLFPLITRDALKSLNRYHDFGILSLLVLSTLSTLTVTLCIVALGIDAYKSRRDADNQSSSGMNSGGWIVGLVAACLTVWAVPQGVRALFTYQHIGRADILLMSLAFAVAVIVLDICLVAKVLRRRSQPL
jgi:hypothetical protein